MDDKLIINKLRGLDPYEFEEFIGDLWSMQQWDTEVTSQAGDKGIDVIATKSFPYDKKTLIQVKKYGNNSNVSGPEIQKYASLKQRDNVDEVVVVTTNTFTSQAVKIAYEFNIKLINKEDLRKIITELSAEELVKSYADQVRPEIDIEPNQSSKINPRELNDENRIVGECELIRLELLGYKYVSTQNAEIRSPKDINGYITSFELTNLIDDTISIHPFDNMNIISKDSYSYSPEKKFSKDRYLPEQWQAQLPEAPPNSKIKFICYFPCQNKFDISKVSISGDRLSFLDPVIATNNYDPAKLMNETHSVELYINDKEDINGLPEAVAEMF